MQTSMNLIVPESLASVYVDTKAARRLVGLYGITQDLESVAQVADRLKACLEADGAGDKIICESLTWHIVVRYARCFEMDRGRNAQLHGAQVAALRDSDLMTIAHGVARTTSPNICPCRRTLLGQTRPALDGRSSRWPGTRCDAID